MAKVAFNVTGVEAGNKDFDTPIPIGLYPAKIKELKKAISKSGGNEMLALTIEITKGDFKGRHVWDYIVMNGASDWKLRQFVDAVMSGKDKGEIDTNKLTGAKLQVRIKHESNDEYGVRSKVGQLLPMPEDQDEEEDDEAEEEAADDDDDSELTIEDLADLDREDLEEIIEEEELEVTFNKRTSDNKLRERIAAALGIEEDDEEPDGDETEDYGSMSLADLKATLSERGLKTSGPKKLLVKRLEKDDAEGSDGDPF